MNLPPDKKPTFENFWVEDARQWRQHDPVVDEILCFFEAKTEDKRLPKRADFSPMEMKSILPGIALLDLIYDEEGSLVDAKTILIGSELDIYYGFLTGKLVSKFPVKEVSKRTLLACKYCIEIKKPFMKLTDTLSEQKDYLTTVALYLPMSSDGEKVDRVFMYIQVKSKYTDQ